MYLLDQVINGIVNTSWYGNYSQFSSGNTKGKVA